MRSAPTLCVSAIPLIRQVLREQREVSSSLLEPLRTLHRYLQLPQLPELSTDAIVLGLPGQDPGLERSIDAGSAWLCRSQNHSASQDGGVARHYILVTGWGVFYAETTGYIVPTLLAYAKLHGDATVYERARRMLKRLASIQLPCGGFQAGGRLKTKRSGYLQHRPNPPRIGEWSSRVLGCIPLIGRRS